MDVTAECWDDMVDIFDGDGEIETESDVVMNQVLDEIGVSLNAQMVDAPTTQVRSTPNTVLNFPSVTEKATNASTREDLAL